MEPDQVVHRGFHFAVVDEADSILIDEARVPLVIAGPTDEKTEDLYHLAELIRRLRRGRDYIVTAGWRNVGFTQSAVDRLQRDLQCGELYSETNTHLLTRLNLALHADVLLRRDVDYLVRDGAIELIDDFTGRVAENRRWPYGLQAAIEAKERLAIRPQGRILNSITLQHFLRQYKGLCGMTGTAQEAADELHDFYQMQTVIVPTNRPCIRRDLPDRLFPTKAAKFDALVREIMSLHERGSPVLVGTASVEESEFLASRLIATGADCKVLNAKNDKEESALIAEAGGYGAITISTNMAGRGTDIRLGGSDERDRDRVIALGGLHVIGTNRHESRRIDNQLRGRSARQGDPGQTQFFVSLEDDLIHRHGIHELIQNLSISPTETEIDDHRVGSNIAHVQRVIEGESFEIRRTLRKYAFVLEQQRSTIQELRRRLLLKLESPSLLREHAPDLFEKLIAEFGGEVVEAAERQITIWKIDQCWSNHLEKIAEIRDQIHLIGMGGLNPLDEFNRLVTAAFRETSARIKRDVLSTLKTVQLTPRGLDFEQHKIVGPASTWTYLINDNPMGDIVERLSRGLKRGLKRMVS
jgi:preprotein translocase subunit SecA